MTKQEKSLNQQQKKKNVKREKKMKEGLISNVKHENSIEVSANRLLDQKAKETTCINSDTTAKIDSNIKRLSDGFACTMCDYSSKQKNHMREHAERHVEGLEYP